MTLIFSRSDEPLKAGAYLSETLQNPKVAKSYDPAEAAFSKGLHVNTDLWGYLHKPENKAQLNRSLIFFAAS